jgi:hypothetical protein
MIGIIVTLFIGGNEWTILSGKKYIAVLDANLVRVDQIGQLLAAFNSVSTAWWWFTPIAAGFVYLHFLRSLTSIPEVAQRYQSQLDDTNKLGDGPNPTTPS